MAKKRKGRPVNGILIVDKPSGPTSNNVLQTVKKLFNAQKAGHTGILDPLASGVLPICLGEATKLSNYLLDADKAYIAHCYLGSVTDTGDSTGRILFEKPVPPLSVDDIQEILQSMLGEQRQIPPMYSALKHQGKPLYELARQGIEVERKARTITIYSLELLKLELPEIQFRVKCSKGTYIRTLCEDIGEKIGCGAHMSQLRRILSGVFTIEQAIPLTEIVQLADPDTSHLDNLLLPADECIKHLPKVTLASEWVKPFQHGQQIPFEAVARTSPEINLSLLRIYSGNLFLGIGLIDKEMRLHPKRLLYL